MRVVWSGAQVIGGGLSTFYFTDGATGQSADVSTFFEAIKSRLAGGVIVTVPSGGDVISDTDGSLVSTWGTGGGAATTGTGNAIYAAGVGARIVWRTAGVNGGRRVSGSTFIVPLDTPSYDASGTLATTVVSNLQSAADALVTAQASAFTIWSRSQNGGAGANHEVTSADAPDKVSWLRSRRT
jgi:hypothetical protein